MFLIYLSEMVKLSFIALSLLQIGLAFTSEQESMVPSNVTPTTSWIDDGKNKLNKFIKNQADIGRQSVGIIGKGSELGNNLANKAADFSSGLAQQTLSDMLELGADSLKSGTDLMHKGINLFEKFGKLFPSSVSDGIQKGVHFANNGVDTINNIGENAIKAADIFGHGAIKTINGLFHKGNDIANDIVQKGTVKVQNTIEYGSDSVTGGIKETVKKIQNII